MLRSSSTAAFVHTDTEFPGSYEQRFYTSCEQPLLALPIVCLDPLHNPHLQSPKDPLGQPAREIILHVVGPIPHHLGPPAPNFLHRGSRHGRGIGNRNRRHSLIPGRLRHFSNEQG